MKITDKSRCDIWYEALLARAVEFTGVFLLASKLQGYFVSPSAGRVNQSGKTSNFIVILNLRLMPGSAPAKSAVRPKTPVVPQAFVEQALQLVRENPKTRLSDSELRLHNISPERVRRLVLTALRHHLSGFSAYAAC